MKLMDLMKQGALTTAARENSKNSENSNSKGVRLASNLINNKFKNSNNSNNSYSCALDGEGRTGTHKPAATAIIAIPATEKRLLPYLDRDGALVIPFGSDPRFHWWNGGQLPSETEKEIKSWKH